MDAIAEALQPELGHPANERARAMIGRRGRSLNLEFEADDSSSLRAIMSSYLRLVAASLNVADALIELDKPRSESR
jgi:tRNA threonylcarbamoyladenosine modification (KEOPS) complex  Pcc1 subunit